MSRTLWTAQQCEDHVMHQLNGWKKLREMNPDMTPQPTLDDLILEHGRSFTKRGTVPITFPVTPKSKTCYLNAWKLMRRFFNRDYYRYCEGYIMEESFVIPVLHGWVLDVRTNVVLDPSIDQDTAAFYYGIVFNRPFTHWLWPELRRKQAIGILGNLWMLHEVDKEQLMRGIEHT